MTDENIDDNSDRMERADRIREMRTGRRSRGQGKGKDQDQDQDTHDKTSDTSDDTTSTDKGNTTSTDEGKGQTYERTESDTPDDQQTSESPKTSTVTDSNTTPKSGSNPSTSNQSRVTDVVEDVSDQQKMDTDHNDAVQESGFKFEGSDESHDEETETETRTREATDGADGNSEGDDVAATTTTTTTTTQTDVAESVTASDAEDAVAQLDAGRTFAIPDQATTVSEDDEQTMVTDTEQTVAAARSAIGGRQSTAVGTQTRVLEFELGDERFCLDIGFIEEIVELENLTRVPNSPSYVEGVVDLRGQVTAIINPKDALDVSDEGQGALIIVFDSEELDEQGHLGWVVDEVRQVTPVSEDEVNESPDDEQEHINGIINRDDEDDFIVWTTPELALNSS